MRQFSNLLLVLDKQLKTDFAGDEDNQIRDGIMSKCNTEYAPKTIGGPWANIRLSLELAAQCERIEVQLASMHVSTDSKDETVHHVFKKERKYHKNGLRQNAEGKDHSEKVC